MSTDFRQIAREEAERAVDSHEDICAERYTGLAAQIANVQKEVETLWRIVAWAGSTGFLLLMGLIGFLAKAQLDSLKELQTAASQRSELREQMSRTPPPQIIIQRAPGTPEIGATVERQNTPR